MLSYIYILYNIFIVIALIFVTVFSYFYLSFKKNIVILLSIKKIFIFVFFLNVFFWGFFKSTLSHLLPDCTRFYSLATLCDWILSRKGKQVVHALVAGNALSSRPHSHDCDVRLHCGGKKKNKKTSNHPDNNNKTWPPPIAHFVQC